MFFLIYQRKKQWKKDQTNVKPYIESTVKEKLRILFKFAQNHPHDKKIA